MHIIVLECSTLIYNKFRSFIFFNLFNLQEKDVREIRDESDDDDEGVEAEVDMTLHGGVSVALLSFVIGSVIVSAVQSFILVLLNFWCLKS